MDDAKKLETYAAAIIIMMLIFTAWGNAVAMVVASAVGLVLGFFLFRGTLARGGAVIALVGIAVGALTVAAVHLLTKKP